MHEGITPSSSLIGEPIASTQWVPAAEPKRTRTSRPWTATEDALVKRHYASGGLPEAQGLFSNRTPEAVKKRALKLKVRSPRALKAAPALSSTPFIDEAIRNASITDPKRGRWIRLERQLRRPSWWISRRAFQLGVAEPLPRGKPWSDRELAILTQHADRTARTISRSLARQGFKRTPRAILVRLNLMRLDRTPEGDRYSGNELARLMGIHINKVQGWIQKGWLRATRDLECAGSPYSIHRNAVRRFIVENVGHVDIRRCEKIWLVELLAGSSDFG